MGTKNFNFTYLEQENKIDLVPDTTTFLDEIDDAIKEVKDSIINIPNSYLLATMNQSQSAVDFYWSDTFENISPTKIGNIIFPYGDLLYMNKIGDWYYILTNVFYAVTKDFKDFRYFESPIEISGNWGCVFVPSDNIAIACMKYKEGMTPNAVGGESPFMRPFMYDYVQNAETGELTFSNKVEITPPNFVVNTSSYIDVDCKKGIDGLYYISFKDEVASKAVLYTATAIKSQATWASVPFNSKFFGYEAPKLIEAGYGKFNLLVSYYDYSDFVKMQFGEQKPTYISEAANKPVLICDVFSGAPLYHMVKCKMNEYNRHMAVIKTDSVINNAFVFTNIAQVSSFDKILISCENGSYEYNGIMLDGATFSIGGSAQLKINITSTNDFDYREQYMFTEINTNASDASIKFDGNVSYDIRNRELFKTIGTSPDGYDLYAGKTGVFKARNGNVLRML